MKSVLIEGMTLWGTEESAYELFAEREATYFSDLTSERRLTSAICVTHLARSNPTFSPL